MKQQNQTASELKDPKEYMQKAVVCFENVIKILCGFDFDSSEALKMVSLAFLKLF